ncbi:MAG: hypothetical protein IJW40_06275 [Clostridia bacterium]|nr:hypothetical protein [Clostridia bacterium]
MNDKLSKIRAIPAPSAVKAYEIAPDGGLCYNPISREKASELHKYDDAERHCAELRLMRSDPALTVRAVLRLPKAVTAYDAVPVTYELSANADVDRPIHLNATAFEDAAREGGKTYYDLTLPGKVDVDWEYLGYVGADDCLSNRACLGADPSLDRKALRYPQYDARPLCASGNLKRSSVFWLKMRYTNTGNTVLDGDGNGTFCVEAVLFRKNEAGEWEKAAVMENLFNRIIDEVYPGESAEMYFTFNHASAYNLPCGEYRVVLNALVRNETVNPEYYIKNIWGGETYSQSAFVITISEQGEITPLPVITKTHCHEKPSRNRWLHKYEEFMTSFDSRLRGIRAGEVVRGTMYLQCAPWTEQVVLRLMIDDGEMAAIALPVKVESDSIKVKVCQSNNSFVIRADGTPFPAISAQSMADMRGNVQLGPDAAGNILDNLLAMKACGVNLINTTAAFEFDGSMGKNRANNIDACWFSLDAARALDLRLEGWIAYPYKTPGTLAQANALCGESYTGAHYGHPDLAAANAKNALWQYLRWGDNYWIGGKDTVVLDAEDSRGWMRIDFNARQRMDDYSKANFRTYLADMYGTIEALNTDWGTEYVDFDAIDPEKGVIDDHGWASYKTEDIVFSEWSRPLEILDMFRTEERIRDYQMLLENVKDELPTAKFNLRTEGANWIVSIDPETDNPHYRHVFYSQRRCGIIAELLQQAGVLYAAADYTTLPYTPSEVAELTARAVREGVVPMLLPQFDRMRDIAINTVHGNDFTYEYHLSGEAVKGAYINTVCSAFEWFRATYENGGVPGILWQDYLCDGYATATQRREIAFFTQKLTEALDSPEGRAWSSSRVQDQSVLAASAGAWTFRREQVEAEIKRVRALGGRTPV